MDSSTVPLLYSLDHVFHAPEGEFEQGKIIAYHEIPARVEGIYRRLISCGIGQPVHLHRPATVDELCSVHSLEMLDFMEAVSHSLQDESGYLYADFFPIRGSMSGRPKSLAGRLGLYCTDPYSPVGQGTWRAAVAAAGLALQGADMIMRRDTRQAYALCRPPGHHAGPDFFGSYCYLNNAALAARRLTALGRVAVLDIDYHHGNGTQAIFWDDPRVLYASLHIDPNLDFPYFNGYSHETGGTHAPGTTVNIPLPPGSTSSSYLQALDALIHTVRVFQPAALVVSLGFDPFQGDPLSVFRVETGAYTVMGSRIAALGMPTLLIQEGGYAVDALPVLVEKFLGGFITARDAALG
jgi:acetoin utilization deacetylase AcuC-like enzyme